MVTLPGDIRHCLRRRIATSREEYWRRTCAISKSRARTEHHRSNQSSAYGQCLLFSEPDATDAKPVRPAHGTRPRVETLVVPDHAASQRRTTGRTTVANGRSARRDEAPSRQQRLAVAAVLLATLESFTQHSARHGSSRVRLSSRSNSIR